jgi:hypothetical protein
VRVKTRLELMLCGLSLLACGGGSTAPKANPCATPGATYLDHFVEGSGGTCGPIPDEIININSDGTEATTIQISCQTESQTGCTAHNTGCTWTTNGVACNATTDVTFASDGSGASGLETVTCSSSSASCTSTYTVTLTRQ